MPVQGSEARGNNERISIHDFGKFVEFMDRSLFEAAAAHWSHRCVRIS